VINPKPFFPLNHFTVPVLTLLYSFGLLRGHKLTVSHTFFKRILLRDERIYPIREVLYQKKRRSQIKIKNKLNGMSGQVMRL
jgi:hypothetical protein